MGLVTCWLEAESRSWTILPLPLPLPLLLVLLNNNVIVVGYMLIGGRVKELDNIRFAGHVGDTWWDKKRITKCLDFYPICLLPC